MGERRGVVKEIKIKKRAEVRKDVAGRRQCRRFIVGFGGAMYREKVACSQSLLGLYLGEPREFA